MPWSPKRASELVAVPWKLPWICPFRIPAPLQALEELCGTFLHRSCHLWLLLKISVNTFSSLSTVLNPCRQGTLHITGSNSLLNKIPHPYPPKNPISNMWNSGVGHGSTEPPTTLDQRAAPPSAHWDFWGSLSTPWCHPRQRAWARS